MIFVSINLERLDKMRKILIATHGKYAEGLKNTAHLFVSEDYDITSISAYVSDLDFKDQLSLFFNSCKLEDEVIILTDISGGSVNRECMKYMSREHTHIISGVNLALILEISFIQSKYLNEETISDLIQKAQKSILYVNKLEAHYDENDE